MANQSRKCKSTTKGACSTGKIDSKATRVTRNRTIRSRTCVKSAATKKFSSKRASICSRKSTRGKRVVTRSHTTSSRKRDSCSRKPTSSKRAVACSRKPTSRKQSARSCKRMLSLKSEPMKRRSTRRLSKRVAMTTMLTHAKVRASARRATTGNGRRASKCGRRSKSTKKAVNKTISTSRRAMKVSRGKAPVACVKRGVAKLRHASTTSKKPVARCDRLFQAAIEDFIKCRKITEQENRLKAMQTELKLNKRRTSGSGSISRRSSGSRSSTRSRSRSTSSRCSRSSKGSTNSNKCSKKTKHGFEHIKGIGNVFIEKLKTRGIKSLRSLKRSAKCTTKRRFITWLTKELCANKKQVASLLEHVTFQEAIKRKPTKSGSPMIGEAEVGEDVQMPSEEDNISNKAGLLAGIMGIDC